MNKTLKSICYSTQNHLSLLLLIFVFNTGYTQKNNYVIHFKEGSSKIGKDKIKTDSNIKMNDTSEIVAYEKNYIEKIETRDGAYRRSKLKKIEKGTSKGLWLEVVVEGKVNLYKDDKNPFSQTATEISGELPITSEGSTTYYINREGESEVSKVTWNGFPGKNFKKAASQYFIDCPILVEDIQNKTYDISNIENVVRFYNMECSQTYTAEND